MKNTVMRRPRKMAQLRTSSIRLVIDPEPSPEALSASDEV